MHGTDIRAGWTMSVEKFLASVLADEGLYCVVGIRAGITQQRFARDIPAAVAYIQSFDIGKYDTYFGTAKFENANSRTATNARWFKAFRLDLDCGENKPYPTQGSAIEALRAFCKKLSLPKPTLINSGYGIHVYWTLNETIDYNTWKPLAENLKQQCAVNGLHTDAGCTADAARILRVPGTHNYKNSKAIPVTLANMGNSMALEDFKTAIYIEAESNNLGFTVPPHASMDPTTRALMGNTVSRFGTIMKKSLTGKGCAQLRDIYVNQEEVDYNLWRGGLSIAVNCEDGETAIHKLSQRHPDYSPEDTARKAADTLNKPYKCTTFAGFNPDGCVDCAHHGKITSPIQLGAKILEASPSDNLVVMKSAALEEDITVEIPEYPFPYFRGKNGGVYKRGMPVPGSEETEEDALIYEYDFYVVKRLSDPDVGESIWLRLHMPKDGIREFSCPLAHVIARDKFAAILAFYGVAASGKKLDGIMTYVTRWVSEMQKKLTAETARQQFGWCDNDQKFILGNREISAQEVTYSPSSAATTEVAAYYGKKGDIKEWSKIVDIYSRPGNEVRAFAMFAGFGSALLKFTGMHGSIMHLTSNKSGIGKSTVQQVINSIWGHPDLAMLNERDKYLARMHRLSVLGNVPACIDEYTKASKEEISEMSFSISQGRPRNRMQSQTNAERSNNLRWSLITFTSGNQSLQDQLYSLKDYPEGELMRIMEFEVERADGLTKEETDALFAPLAENYGLAGEIFIRYVIPNLSEVKTLIKSMQKKFDIAAQLTQRERYWSSMVACTMVAGILTHRLGLHHIDVSTIYRWAVKEVHSMMKSVGNGTAASAGPLSQIGAYLNENNNNILVINESVDKRSGLMEAPIREPRGELVVRYEPDAQRLYITTKHFRAWCSENQVSYKDLRDTLAKLGVLHPETRKAMAKGTLMSTPAVQVLTIDSVKAKHFDLDLDGMEKSDEPDQEQRA